MYTRLPLAVRARVGLGAGVTIPWPQARQQAGYVAAILEIGMTESLPETRLFDQWNMDEVDRQEQSGPVQECRRQHDERFGEENQDDTRDHRIAHKSVGAAHDQLARRIPRRQRTSPLGGETP